jgi:hypothetical protein
VERETLQSSAQLVPRDLKEKDTPLPRGIVHFLPKDDIYVALANVAFNSSQVSSDSMKHRGRYSFRHSPSLTRSTSDLPGPGRASSRSLVYQEYALTYYRSICRRA